MRIWEDERMEEREEGKRRREEVGRLMMRMVMRMMKFQMSLKNLGHLTIPDLSQQCMLYSPCLTKGF